MGVLIQAMVWMGLPQPPMWQLVLYMLCIGMFGAGVGMLYTPILVDRLQLTFPSGLAVANILRALTDPDAAEAVGRRDSSAAMALGVARRHRRGQDRVAGRDRPLDLDLRRRHDRRRAHRHRGDRRRPRRLGADPVFRLDRLAASRRAVPQDHVPDRARHDHGRGDRRHLADPPSGAWQRGARQAAATKPVEQDDWKRTNTGRLVAWVVFWGVGVVVVGSPGAAPAGRLPRRSRCCSCSCSRLVNGISVGISDSNPISSAFVVSVILMAALGLKDPAVGLMAGDGAAGVDQRRLRHAAGPLDRLAPRHQPRRSSSATRSRAS